MMDDELEALPLPDAFRCPITQEVMEDPVRTKDGVHVFERAALDEWFRRGHRTNPLTNQELLSLELTEDRLLRTVIWATNKGFEVSNSKV